MALVACKECGKEVASGAPTCPHCGVKFPAGGQFLSFRENAKGCGCLLALLFGLMALFIIAA